MIKLAVDIFTYANAVIDVEITDEELAEIANELGVPVDQVTVEDMREKAIEKAIDEHPLICAQCSGWGQNYGLDLGEWDVADDSTETKPEYKSVRIKK